jgi:hypothetical protein
MQKLLLSTQQKCKENIHKSRSTKRKGKKTLLEFLESSQQVVRSTRISKRMAGMSIKCGCQRAFITKQPYLDHSFCQLIYLCPEHKNRHGMVCHGKNVVGYCHSLGSQLSNGMKAHLMDPIRQGLSPAQVMAHHKMDVREKVLWTCYSWHFCFALWHQKPSK